MCKVTVYSQSVKLESNNSLIINYIRQFLNQFYTLRQQGFGKESKPDIKVFASKLEGQGTYYLHITQFLHFLNYLEKNGVKLNNTERINKSDYKVVTTDYEIRPQWTLRDYQKPVVEFLLNNPTKSKLVPIQTGQGKDQPLTAKIKIPGGWSTMGDMTIGTKIIAQDGSETTVNGVFPQGVKPVYKVKFSDGRSTECGAEHLWKVYYANAEPHARWRVVNTLEIQRLISMPDARVCIPLPVHEELPPIDLPMDPYLLGVFIGDTYPRSKKIINKVIPDVYLYSTSKEQKVKLIQGLMDSNGGAGTPGSILYTTTSYELALQVQYLIRSIGGIAYISKHNVQYNYNGEELHGSGYYNVNIRHSKPSELFSLILKKNSVNDYDQYSSALKLLVLSVEYIGEKETQCISIGHPDKLYVTDDFIVTHNTVIALYAIAKLRQRLGIVILPTFVEKWASDIVNIHDAKPDDVMVVQGSKSLKAIIELAKTDSLDNNYIIFSNRTLQDYVTQYERNPELCTEEYGCAPIELFPLLGIGIMLIDESHMHFHSLYKIILHTNVKYMIGLTATLLSDNYVIKFMHRIIYPEANVYVGKELDKYADVYAISYTISEYFMKGIRTTNYGSNSYSHIAFEQSILKREDIKQRYLMLINSAIDSYFIETYKQKDKVLIFVATVKLATYLKEYLTTMYPEFAVNRYCEDDPHDNLMTSDIIISTVISAGTGEDIRNLRVVVQTVSISSSVMNIQSLGRLRKLSDRDVKFCYLYAGNIPKHKQYHMQRTELFKNRVANIAYRQSLINL